MTSGFGGFMAGSIVGKLLLDKSGWNASVKSVGKDKRVLSDAALEIGRKMQNIGRSMSIAGLAIVGTLSGVIKVFADFDQAMTESLAIMGDVSAVMRGEMAEAAKEMSEGSTFAAKELAEAYFYLASAGLDAEQSIAALPVVTKFAQAGAFNLARATDLLTDAQSALGLSTKDATKNQENMIYVSDVLVKANALANATVSQFSEALTNKAGPAMRAYGIELEVGVATLAAYADQGVKGSEAGSAFSIVLRDLQRSAIGNSKAFKAAGIAVYDANGNLSNMGEIIEQLEKHLGALSPELRKAALTTLGFQERSQSFLLTLIGTSDKIKEYEANLRMAGGTTDEVSKKQLRSLTNQMKLAKNSITNAGIALGEQLAPLVIKLAVDIGKTIKKVSAWIKENESLVKGVGELAIKAGLFFVAVGPILIILPKLAAGFTLLWGAITGPVGLVVVAIASVGLAINELVKTHKKALQDMSFNAKAAIMDITTDGYTYLAMLERVKDEGGDILEKWKDLTFRFGGDYVKIFAEISTNPAFSDLKTILDDIMQKQEGLSESGGKLKDVNIKLGKSLSDAAKDGTFFKDMITELGGEPGSVVEATAKRIKSLDTALTDLTDRFISGVLSVSEYLQAIKDLKAGIYDLKEYLKDFDLAEMELEIEHWVATWESADSAIKSVFDSIGIYIFDTHGDLKEVAKTTTKEIKSFWSEMADGLRTKWASTIGEVLRGATSLQDGLKGIFDAILVQFTDMIGAMIVSWITDFLGGVLSSTKDAASKVVDSVTDIATNVLSGGLSDIIGGALGGLVSGLVGGGGGPSTTDSWHFQEIWKNTKNIQDWHRINHQARLDEIAKYVDNQNPKLQEQIRILRGIRSGIGNVAKALQDIPGGQHGLDFQSGSEGGLVRYHPRENISIQPMSQQPDINLNSHIVLEVDGRAIMQATAPHSVRMMKQGRYKIHQRGIVST